MTNYGHSESISESLTFKKQFELRDSGASPEWQIIVTLNLI